MRGPSPIAMAACLALPLALGACGAETAAVYGAAAATATIVETDKTPPDIIASIATGLDCDTLRAKRDDGAWCRQPDAGVVIEPPLYCYRSLGAVTCYDRPDPYGTGAREVR